MILRELRRLRVDPAGRRIEFLGGTLSETRFEEIVFTTNDYVECKPSLYQSMYGPRELALHWPNVRIQDGEWVKNLLIFVERMVCRLCLPHCPRQLLYNKLRPSSESYVS